MEFREGDIVNYNFDGGFLQGVLSDDYFNENFPLKLLSHSGYLTFTSCGREYNGKDISLTLVSRPKKKVTKYQWLIRTDFPGEFRLTFNKYADVSSVEKIYLAHEIVKKLEESAEEFEVEEN